ncbi:winged helix-turn-helix domain-containing protein [Steroidobacter sp.]|uniref:winged helix-turn-helix domain-containing protein n=1 Tax=Steroidobacter sp. TaxID=1978227 RepID=UPI001A39DD60|nr:transcriptional regulator [Steroidobacter sp.]MBL8269326.1 transcriptional regulator [Steroidobacter sp.]
MVAKAKVRVVVAENARQRRKLVTVASMKTEDGESKSERLIYERVRLGIMSALAVREEMTFNELKSLFDISDGNLGGHARKLEDAGYVTCTKSFEDRRPRTAYRITEPGRAALNRYLDHVEAVIRATRG